jgi:small subunit ribosomal protein S2
MNRLPEAVFIVDPSKEKNAVAECRCLGVKIVSLIDTDSNPDMVDLAIPGNDDSIRSIRLILGYVSDAINAGKASIPRKQEEAAKSEEFKAVPSIR